MRLRSVKPKKPKRKIKTVAKPAANLRDGALLQRDHELVQRCLKGDVDGWQQLFDLCQPQLLVSIRALLKPHGLNSNLAEEIAARVWFSLIGTNGNLLNRYDAQRGCQLTTFISALARHELLMYWRAEKRQRKREQSAMSGRPSHGRSDVHFFRIVWDEFVGTLSQREREFLEQVLLVPPTERKNEKFSQANVWQLRSRVLAKLKHYSNDNA